MLSPLNDMPTNTGGDPFVAIPGNFRSPRLGPCGIFNRELVHQHVIRGVRERSMTCSFSLDSWKFVRFVKFVVSTVRPYRPDDHLLAFLKSV